MPKKEKEMNTKNNKVVKLTTMAMLTAIGTILQYLEVSIPIMPEFIKLDFSDLPQLIGAITLGPGACLICKKKKGNSPEMPFNMLFSV